MARIYTTADKSYDMSKTIEVEAVYGYDLNGTPFRVVDVWTGQELAQKVKYMGAEGSVTLEKDEVQLAKETGIILDAPPELVPDEGTLDWHCHMANRQFTIFLQENPDIVMHEDSHGVKRELDLCLNAHVPEDIFGILGLLNDCPSLLGWSAVPPSEVNTPMEMVKENIRETIRNGVLNTFRLEMEKRENNG